MKKSHYLIPSLLCAALLTACKEEAKTAETAPVKVTTQKVATTTIPAGQGFSGTVEETNAASLSFSSMGTIEELHVSEGQMVSQGALIGVLDATTARNSLDAATATLQQAQDAYNRMKQLHDSGSLPEIQWIEAESKLKQAVAAEQIARKSLADCRLYAPFSGFIAKKSAEVGQNVVPGMEVAKIVKIGQVKVKIAVPENEIAAIRKGDKVKIAVDALGGKVYEGTVCEKGVVANAMSRSYDVKVAVPNPGHELLPGMVCNAHFSKGEATECIVVPSRVVLLDSENRTFVWLAQNGKAVKRMVGIGGQTAGGVIVTSGLKPGDAVITEGGQKVSQGMSVKG